MKRHRVLLCVLVAASHLGACRCNRPTSVAASSSVESGHVEYYEVTINSADTRTLRLAALEVTNRDFCAFLNAIEYREPGVDVIGLYITPHSQAKHGVGELDHHRLTTVYLIEHAESSIKRMDSRFVPAHGAAGRQAANCITYFGARAYCEWLTKRIGHLARLPTELEWQTCLQALVVAGVVIDGCPGGVWEWCDDWYDPAREFKFCTSYQSPGAGPATSSPKRVVRGGLYHNRRHATIEERSANLLLGGGQGEQGTGLRVVIEK